MTGIANAERGHLQAGAVMPRRADTEEGVQISYPQPTTEETRLQGITALFGESTPLWKEPPFQDLW